ncbi:DsbC family protein [Rudaea cellulosilytica]|jgi:thiol:disulfide interchange protein DsbC|uniref:DsbC family protein n=1 Tax=Rudaea cellulosilytica TaxID=540746 RepID=UPI0003A1EFB5|nr:DsbC family protein [Rudaea cellulosilytica]
MLKHLLAAASLALVAVATHAQSAPSFTDVSSAASAPSFTPTAPEEKTIYDALSKLAPNVKIQAMAKAELPGFYEVVVSGGQVVYASADGKYLIQGDVIDVAQKASLPGRAQSSLRLASLKTLPQSKRIVFAPANPKHTVTVFTDVDCPYCRQFHKQIAAYNQVGIAVEYVLFPLAIHPGADKKAEAVWCAQDRNAAYTAAMNGQDPGKKTCANPVAETTALALKIGISGTPTILNESGVQVNGGVVQDPAKFLAELDRLAAQNAKGAVASK